MMGLLEIRAILDRETRNARSSDRRYYVLSRTLAEFDRSMKHPQHVFGSEPECVRCGAYGPEVAAMNAVDTLRALDACYEAVEWAKAHGGTLEELWAACPRGDWLLWYAGQIGAPQVALVRAAAACAELALPYAEEARAVCGAAIAAARAWADAPSADATATVNAATAAANAATDAANATAYAAAAAADAAAEAAEAAANAADATDARTKMRAACADVVRAHVKFRLY